VEAGGAEVEGEGDVEGVVMAMAIDGCARLLGGARGLWKMECVG
jgi:hypothetical protein